MFKIVMYKNQLGSLIYDDHEKICRFKPCEPKRPYSIRSLEKVLNDTDYREATNNEKLDFIKGEFDLGKIKKIHTIGDFQIIEYVWRLTGTTMYNIYIDFEDCYFCCDTLDKAIISAISIKYEGTNHHSDYYFMKMLGIDN